MLQGSSLPMLRGPMPSEPQGPSRMNKQPHLTRPLAQNISQATISHFLYGPTTDHSWSLNTAEFDYRWDILRSGAFHRNVEQREVVILWDSGVPIWHFNRLIHLTKALDIGLIRDELGDTVVPLAIVQKLEAQMATLLHHIQPWMQKSIAESEARIDQMMEGMMDQKVHAVNKRLNAFELRVLE
ncbi:hypothetical protein H5410_061045 [Solanum commersonii]|uniref:Uncharacterized protein n=1 Tax=Solanum commersonii TaxID=4109 RepID=A0A9J5W7G2_SOLCO|nr:hypothetical protein H5410_061045 [Solanum commersonii]